MRLLVIDDSPVVIFSPEPILRFFVQAGRCPSGGCAVRPACLNSHHPRSGHPGGLIQTIFLQSGHHLVGNTPLNCCSKLLFPQEHAMSDAFIAAHSWEQYFPRPGGLWSPHSWHKYVLPSIVPSDCMRPVSFSRTDGGTCTIFVSAPSISWAVRTSGAHLPKNSAHMSCKSTFLAM